MNRLWQKEDMIDQGEQCPYKMAKIVWCLKIGTFFIQKGKKVPKCAKTIQVPHGVWTWVTFFKLHKMIEKLIKFYFQWLYLKEYKKGFAFLTKFYNFGSRGGLSWALKMQLKISSQTIGLTLNVF